MILVDDVLLSDVARKSRKASKLAAMEELSDPDSLFTDLFSKGRINKNFFLKEISESNEEKDDEELV